MTDTEYEVKFHFGVRTIKKRDLYLTALVLNLGVDLVHKFLKVEPLRVWEIIDEVGQHYKIRIINELILRVPQLLSARINRDLDKAIEDYNDVLEFEDGTDAIFTEKPDGETPLGGEMRLRAPWLLDNNGD